MYLKCFIFVFSIIILNACAPLRPVHQLEEDESINNITIIRNYNYIASGYHFWPTINGKEISGLLPNQYISFYAPQGETSFGVKCYGGVFPKWWHDEISVEVLKGNKYYFVISPYGLGCADIKQIELSEATEYLTSATFIKTGHMSDCDENSIAVSDESPQLCLP